MTPTPEILHKKMRPVLRFHGGKWRISDWIISFFPPHTIYVEPFGGAASVLMRKTKSTIEIYNDIDTQIVNVFRILRHPRKSKKLFKLLELTPYSRQEFNDAYSPSSDPIEQARRTIIISYHSYGTRAATSNHRTGFRMAKQSQRNYALDWLRYPSSVFYFCRRLKSVIIENSDYKQIIFKNDSPATLFYLDPPYPHSTRCISHRDAYRYEFSTDQHIELAAILHNIKGMAVLSTYESPLYHQLYPDWKMVQRRAYVQSAQGRGSRTSVESLLLSPNIISNQLSLLQ